MVGAEKEKLFKETGTEKIFEYLNMEEGVNRVINFLEGRRYQKTVIIIFGLGGSGKTYFIEQLESILNKDRQRAGHIDGYQDEHSYKYASYFEVFIIHASGACDYEMTQKIISEKMGRRADLSIYIENETISPNFRFDKALKEKCDVAILNPFRNKR